MSAHSGSHDQAALRGHFPWNSLSVHKEAGTGRTRCPARGAGSERTREGGRGPQPSPRLLCYRLHADGVVCLGYVGLNIIHYQTVFYLHFFNVAVRPLSLHTWLTHVSGPARFGYLSPFARSRGWFAACAGSVPQ